MTTHGQSGAPGRERVPGHRFKEGKLYIFTERSVSIVDATGPVLQAVRRRDDDGEWRAYSPEQRLVHPYRSRRKKKPASGLEQLSLFGEQDDAYRRIGEKRRAYDSFRFALDRDLAKRVEPFPEMQFRIIQLAQQYDWYRDLLASNRALAFGVANAGLFHECLFESGDIGLVRTLKQRDIADLLGFPATKSAVQQLRRVCPESLHAHHALQLRDAMTDEARSQKLRHASRINAGVVELVSDDALLEAATLSLIEEVAADRKERHRATTAGLLRDALTMHRVIHERRKPPRFKDREKLRTIHDELAEAYRRAKLSFGSTKKFPPPPVRGNAAILPLRDALELVREGEMQKNCVGSYAERVLARYCYIYRVLSPERATLSLVRDARGKWRVNELYRSCNRECGGETWEVVGDWLDERMG